MVNEGAGVLMANITLPKNFMCDRDWEYSIIDDEIEELEWYFKSLEGLISSEEKREISNLEREAIKIPEHARSEFWSDWYPYWWQDVFATQLRFSFITWAIAVLEQNLKYVCSQCAAIAEKEWEEPNREILKSAKKFLGAIGFRQPTEELWESLETRIKVRNFLVHQGPIVPDVEISDNSARAKKIKVIKRIAQETTGVEIDGYQLKIDAVFCERIIQLIKEFFSELHAEQGKIFSKH